MALSLHQQSELLSGVTNEYLQKLLQNPEMMKELELMEAPVLIEVASRNPDTKPQVNTNTIRDQKLQGMREGMQQRAMPEGMGGMPEGMGGPPGQAPGIGQFAQGGMIPGYHSGGGIPPHPHGSAVGHLITDDLASLEDRTAEALENLTLPSVMEAYARGLGGLMPSPVDYHVENLDEEGNFISPEGSLYRTLFEPEASEVRALLENDADESAVDTSSAAHALLGGDITETGPSITDQFGRYHSGERPDNLDNIYNQWELEQNENDTRGLMPSEELMNVVRNALAGGGDDEIQGMRERIDAEEAWRRQETPEEMDRRLAREAILERREGELGLLRGSQAQEIEDMKTQAFINNLLLKSDYSDSISAIWDRKGEQRKEITDLQGLIDTGMLTSLDEDANRSRQSLFELKASLDQAAYTADRNTQIEIAKIMQNIDQVTRTIQDNQTLSATNVERMLTNLRTLLDVMPDENQGAIVRALEEVAMTIPRIVNPRQP